VGTHEARQLFLVSRMYTCSEDADYPAYTSLSFTDFLEALARLSDVRVLPSPMELSSCGWDNIYQWCVLPLICLPLHPASSSEWPFGSPRTRGPRVNSGRRFNQMVRSGSP